MTKNFVTNCSKCGHFVSQKTGKIDMCYDYYAGGWELDKATCANCLKQGETAKKRKL